MKLVLVAAILAGSTLTTAGTLSRPTLLRREAGAITPNGMCGMVEGGDGKGYKCGTVKPCCSKYGWCGNSNEHCGTGCQNEFGTCKGSDPSTYKIPSPDDDPVTTVLPTLTDSPSSDVGSSDDWIRSCTKPNTIALTYDDGPHEYTGALLDLLKSNNAKVTFFINGKNWGPEITKDEGKQKLIKRMVDEGHQVASHTWAHEDLDTLGEEEIKKTMVTLDEALKKIINKVPKYMRPPLLHCGNECLPVMKKLDYKLVHAPDDTLDWKYKTTNTIEAFNRFKNPFDALKDGGSMLVLMHDVHNNTVKNLTPAIFNHVKSSNKKVEFVTVGECLGKKPEEWYKK